MKEQHEHLMLWQKRNELRIEDDAQHDWQNMQGILDRQMPVAHTPGGVSGGGTGTGSLSYLSGFKLLTAIIITAAAASVIAYYVFVKDKVKTNVRPKADTTVTVGSPVNEVAHDSVGYNNSAPDSLQGNSNTDNTATSSGVKDSNTSTAVNNNTPNATNSAIKPGSIKGNEKAVNVPLNTSISPSVNTATVKGVTVAKNSNKNINATSHGNVSALNGHHTTNNTSTLTGKTTSVNAKTRFRPSVSENMVSHDRHSGVKPGSLTKSAHTAGINNRSSSGRRIAGHALALANNGIPSRSGNIRGTNQENTGRGRSGSDKNGKDIKSVMNGLSNMKNNTVSDAIQTANTAHRDSDIIQPFIAPLGITNFVDALSPSLVNRTKAALDSEMAAKRPQPIKPTGSSNFDYGILMGLNASGSFTAQDKNKNFYGSFPVDIYFGAFGTYHFNDKWGLNLQLRGLNPQTISGTYTHINESKKDTNQVLTMTDSRKIYTADAALHLVFKPAAGLSLKAGPVFGYALKEANGSTGFQTGPLKKDSAYYVGVTKLVNATTYNKSLTIGLSVGASYQYGRFIFDAAYIRNFTGVTVGSTLGSYTATGNQFLFSVGFKLNRTK